MTLLRQLVIVIVTLFSLLFAGSVIINVNNTRNYLNNQLRSISQDMATSLGLSVSPHVAKREMALVESMVNAVFDSGYYREVIVADVNGKTMIERSQEPTIEGVPAWFIDLIPLETPVGEALVMAGWQQAGTVRISANPGYAYATLWSNSIDAFWWFLGSSVFAFVLGIGALHFVLRPLRDVEAQAKAICDREYSVQGRMPWTLELRSVVSAMNRMTSKVKDMFDEQAAAMDRVRTDAYVDTTTGLANRRYFDMQLRNLIESPDSFGTGAVIFLELHEFKRFNERRGYQAGDALLKATGKLIARICRESGVDEHFEARLSGPNFAIVLVDVEPNDALAVAEQIARALPKLHATGVAESADVAHLGIAPYQGQPLGQLLGEADLALRAAQVKGANALHMNDSRTASDFAGYTATRWKEVLSDILAQRRVELHVQPAVASDDDSVVLHQETLMRVEDPDGKSIPAGILIPMARRLHLVESFDRLVVEDVVARLAQPANAQMAAAINLFPSSIQDAGFVAWLVELLRRDRGIASRLSFEVTEHGVTDKLDALRGWIERIAETGARTGLDQFGRGFTSFDYLSTLKLNYVKIDGGYVRGIDVNKDNQIFVDSLVKIAHGLDIEVIAESVETPAERETLKSLRVDGVKGFGVKRPEPWA